jgi:hypothetical protein
MLEICSSGIVADVAPAARAFSQGRLWKFFDRMMDFDEERVKMWIGVCRPASSPPGVRGLARVSNGSLPDSELR